MNLTEQTLSQSYAYKGKIINMRVDDISLPNGKGATREVVEHPGGVCVAPLTDEGELLFVRQYRYPYKQVVLELPAGKKDKGEDPLLCGIRELKEETGAVADEIIPMGTLYPSPGYTDEVIHLYLAKGLHFGEMNPDEDEFLEPMKIPLEKAVEMVMNGEISDSKTQVLILKIAIMNCNKL